MQLVTPGPFGSKYSGGWSAPSPSYDLRSRSLTTERISAGPRGTTLPAFLPYFDDQTGETPAARRAYRLMLADPWIKGALIGKIFGVLSQDLQTHPHDKGKPRDKDVGEFCHWNLTRRLTGGVPQLGWNLLIGGCVDGFSVLEKVWGIQDRGKYRWKTILRALKAKDPDNDLVLDINEFRDVVGVRGLRYNAGESYAPTDFLIYRHLPLYSNPTGMSDLRAAYQTYWMADTVKKLRAMGNERFALPILKGQYASPTQKPTLEKALANARYSNWISVPQGVQVDAIQLAGGSLDVFRNTLQDLREDAFLAIQYATLQALTGGQGVDRGDSEVHQDTASQAKWYLAQAVCAILNDHEHGLLRDLTDRNYRDADAPHCTLKSVNTAALAQSMSIDAGLHSMGIDLSADELRERYGRTPPKDDKDRIPGVPVPPPMPDPNQVPVDDLGGFDLGNAPPADEPPPEETTPTDQADAVQGQDLRSTVGGLQAIGGFQEKVYAGEVPRDAAIAAVQLLFGFKPDEAESLFPQTPPEKLTPGDAEPGKGGASSPFDEDYDEFDEGIISRLDKFASQTGYTGEKKDKRGRRMCYQQGKRVACQKAPVAPKQRRGKLEDVTEVTSKAWQTQDKETLDRVAAKIRESGPGSGVGVTGLRSVAKALGIKRTMTKQDLVDSILAKFGNHVLETQVRDQVVNEAPVTASTPAERKQADAAAKPAQFVPQSAEEKLIQDAVKSIHGDWANREQFEKWTNEEIARKAREKQKAAHSYKIKPGTLPYMEQQKRREDALQAEKASGVPFLSRFADGFIDMRGGDDRQSLDWAKANLGKDPNAPKILSQLRARTIDNINKSLWTGGQLVDAAKATLAAPGVQIFGNFGLRELQDMIAAGGLSKWTPEDRPEWQAQEKKTAEAKQVKAALQSGAIPVSPARAAQDAAARKQEVEREREKVRVQMRAQGKSEAEIEKATSKIADPPTKSGPAGADATENRRRVQRWQQAQKEPAKARLEQVRNFDKAQEQGRKRGQGRTFVGRVLSGVMQNQGKRLNDNREQNLKDILAGKVNKDIIENALAHAHDQGYGTVTPQEFAKLARAAYNTADVTSFADSPTPTENLQVAMAQRLARLPDPEKYLTLFATALEETGGKIKHSLSIADRLYEQPAKHVDDTVSILTAPPKKNDVAADLEAAGVSPEKAAKVSSKFSG